MLEALKDEVCRMNLELPKNRLVTMTSGNVSGRDRRTEYIVIKPSGLGYDKMKPEDMVVVDLKGAVIEGKHRPSVDTLSHLVVYRSDREIGGIVHTHSNFAAAFAVVGKPLPVYMSAHADEFGAEIPVTRLASPTPLEDVGDALVETLSKRYSQAVLLRNHGVFTFGESPKAAVKAAVMVEDIAKTYWLAMQVGKPKALSKTEAAKWFKRYHEVYGQKK
jgi:L-ribulose-5-phosphate 4-epimerase